MLPSFAIQRPSTLAAAVQMIGEDSVPYWGGTELLLAMKMGLLRPQTLVDLKRVGGLDGIHRDGSELVIGAGVTHDQLARDQLVGHLAPLLSQVEATVGNARVRAQGTIGGNLCFAEPRSDVATALIALDASVGLLGPEGARRLSVQDFVLGAYWTDRAAEELLVDIRIPLPAAAGAYEKYQIIERPTVAVAAVRLPSGRCRVVVGAAAEVPYVAEADSPEGIDPSAIAAELEPVADLTGSERYKRHVTEVFLSRALFSLGALERDSHV